MLFLPFSFPYGKINYASAASVPSIISYQGRLTDSNGNLLGGSSGSTYYFKFSLWNSATVKTGTLLWPPAGPTPIPVVVKQGVFSVNIGDTADGYPDALTYPFNNPNIYLQVDVSKDNSSFESLSPRQIISSSAFAQISGAVNGTGQSSIGTTTPLSNSVLTTQATTSNSVPISVLGAIDQSVPLLQVSDSSLNHLFSIDNNGNVLASSSLQVTGKTRLYDSLTGTSAAFSNITSSGLLSVIGLSSLTLASSTAASALDGFYAGRVATTTIVGDNATSTFAGGGDKINAISGTITVSPNLKIAEIQKSDNLIPLWIQSPNVSADQKSLSFAGIVPGGFNGAHELLDLIVSASSSGTASIGASSVEAYANDGKATLIPLQTTQNVFSVSSEKATSTLSLNDSLPPEAFTVSIDSSPLLFGGAPFAVFNTEDKQSGIDHYEIAYSFFGVPSQDQWITASSPYELPKEALAKRLYVKAIDHAGNYAISQTATPGYYTRIIIFAIIALLILCALSVAALRSYRLRRSRSS